MGVGIGWRRWRLKCEDMDCVCVSFQRILPKDYRARLENGKVDFLSYSYSSWSKNGNIDIPCQWLCISLQGCLHLWRCLWVWCVDTYFTAAWGFLLIPHFFRSHFSGWKSLRISWRMGMLVFVSLCVCVWVFLVMSGTHVGWVICVPNTDQEHNGNIAARYLQCIKDIYAMTHLYRKHIAATYLERSGEISPCIRDAFPLQVGGTDSAVSPAHNEHITGACWKYKPGTSPTHNGQEWCRLGR